jgi:dihydrofolate synthase/folylpolyglutamate synthase
MKSPGWPCDPRSVAPTTFTFQEALAWLHGAQFTGIKLGLENTNQLLAAAGHPERGLRFLHVAGTNGKGSVCAMLDAALRAAGHRTGLYTSPHLVDFRERIRVDGVMIPREATTAGLSRLRHAVRDWDAQPTFFELATVLAIDHFARSACDVVILETGMGGRLDSTNAVLPCVSVITPIAMDHTAWLGDTLAKIAAEKAGIIKPRIPVVSAPQAPPAAAVLTQRAQACGSSIHFVDAPSPYPVALEGAHQRWNAALAEAAIHASALDCPPEAIARGLATVQWPARFQRVGERTIIDGAHNRHSAEALVSTWRTVFGATKAHLVFGALRDKDSPSMLQVLEEIASSFSFVPVKNERSADPAYFLKQTSLPARTFASLELALASTLENSAPVLVTGSLFLAGEALALLGHGFPGE